ncbi:MAG: hypothetical protein ACJ796_16595 [Gemmatimonadaceae bacterium]
MIAISMAIVVSVCATPRAANAQALPPVLRAIAVDSTAPVKIYHPAGTLRIVGWDRDSLVLRGRLPRDVRLFFGGSARGVKFGVEDLVDKSESTPVDLVVQVPRHARLSVKTASADVRATDVSGWFYSATGTIAISGNATSVDAETMSGNLSLDVTTPWVRAKTGDGHLLLRGRPQDADASTIGGTLDVASSATVRGRFASVTGDIRYAGAPPQGSILEFSNHEGAVDFLLPRDAAGVFDLWTVSGAIENGFTGVRPAASAARRGDPLRLSFGRDGGHVIVRTFKGPIRLRPQ